MRSIAIGDRSLDIRGLTVKEIKQLKKEGVPVSRLGFDAQAMFADMAKADEVMDQVLQMAMMPRDWEWLQERPNRDLVKVWKAALAETFGSEDEEKN